MIRNPSIRAVKHFRNGWDDYIGLCKENSLETFYEKMTKLNKRKMTIIDHTKLANQYWNEHMKRIEKTKVKVEKLRIKNS